jgi:hypothetical protein
MAGLGVCFALSEAQLGAILGRADQDDLRAQVDVLEDAWDEAWTQELDEAWDGIHRCLSDGTLEPGGGDPPLKWAVFGGEDLSGDPDWHAMLVRPAQTKQVAEALDGINEQWWRDRYATLAEQGYRPHDEEDDCEYTWDWFLELRELYRVAAEAGRAVLFTVDRS